MGGRGVAVARLLLAGMVFLLAVIAYNPFRWDPPRIVRNQVTRTADGSLWFGGMNNARTPGTPAWLDRVRTSGSVQIKLEVKPRSARQRASMMMLASNFWDTDFAIGQDHSGLVVWLRRPGSDANGDPPFTVGGALPPRRWASVDVVVQRDSVRIQVNGRTRLAARVPAVSTRVWSAGQVALGDEVHGGGPWRGTIRYAQVSTPGYAVDYVRPGALSIPGHYLYFPDHIEPFPPPSRADWLTFPLKLLLFVPVGFLLVWARRPPIRPIPAALLAAGLAVLLAAGKFLFYGRHMAVADIVMQTAGGLLGALLAWRWHAVTRRTGRPRPRGGGVSRGEVG
jgi:hypothetical protein